MTMHEHHTPSWMYFVITKEQGKNLGWKHLPFVDDYGLSSPLVHEYWKKQTAISRKWEKRINDEHLVLRVAVALCIFTPIIVGLTKSAPIGAVVFALYCCGEYIVRMYMKQQYEKELKTAEIPMIEKYLNALWEWSNNKI